MCTCINYKTIDNYFGRTMDIENGFQEKIVITPRNYPFQLKNGNLLSTTYAMIGMAAVVQNYPLYADATNEKGVSMAGLNFLNTAHYFSPNQSKLNLAPYELIPYFLGQCSTVAEIIEKAKELNITNIPFSKEIPTTELHWMISDKDQCIVMEQTENGLKIYDNPIGVLTNNPTFDYQTTMINNFMNLTPRPCENKFSSKINLEPYSLGIGAIGLPGDNSSTSRFIRCSFNKLNAICSSSEEEAVTQFFHILDSVFVILGTTFQADNKAYITRYSSCMNTTKGIYYYKTYNNNQITAIRLGNEKNKKWLTTYELIDHQQIKYIN